MLVHGASADHTRWEAVRPLLEPHVTVYAVDRRGRGASGDAAAYTLDDEAADVAAVVDAVASSTGEQVDLFGHSYGGICALEAALLTRGIRRLVLHESNVGARTPQGFVDGLAALLADGRREEVDEGVASTAMLAATLPGARVVTLQGQGHVAQLTAPELFAAALLRFLRDD